MQIIEIEKRLYLTYFTICSVSTLDDVSFVSAEETVADLRDFDGFR
jgi:hypothetical protein